MADDLARVRYPFPHNWANQYRVKWEYLTEIITSEAGVEQRIALRSTPRRSISTSVQANQADFRKFMRIVAAAQNLPLVAPDRSWSTTVSDSASAGAISFQCASVDRLYIGQEILIGEGAEAQLAVIDDITGLTVIVVDPLGAIAADTPVYGAVTAQWPQQFSARASTNNLIEADLEFRVMPLKERDVPSSPGATFNGREVFPFNVNWAGAVEIDFSWPTVSIDYERGAVAVFRPIDFPSFTPKGQYLFASSADALAFVDFFKRMKGQRTAFYKPNETEDMRLVGTVSIGDSNFFVEGVELANDFSGHPVFNAVQIDLNDGSTLRRNITIIVTSFSNSRLTVDVPFDRAFGAADVRKISWLLYSRFATDGIEMSFETDQVAKSSVAIRSLPAPTDEFADLRSTLEGDDRETVPGDDRVVFTI
ncbi:hypothetical protein [Sphingobium lignivorans]|uniref:Uncharacterized protein n=1 Tax=Sphingobium lignivorans TaxID=2735886 RepID=A0ABR6NF93_9SPHN|nr:hypothetical protein [Sphingobium lignivorans]MBB5985936.1 hypothetical protein [Sphingobium lignivorans]